MSRRIAVSSLSLIFSSKKLQAMWRRGVSLWRDSFYCRSIGPTTVYSTSFCSDSHGRGFGLGGGGGASASWLCGSQRRQPRASLWASMANTRYRSASRAGSCSFSGFCWAEHSGSNPVEPNRLGPHLH